MARSAPPSGRRRGPRQAMSPRQAIRPRPSIRPAGPPRDRILGAASVLFAERGLNRAGVDTLIAEADVAKATFYRYFPSKDDLIVAWLADSRTRWFERVLALAQSRAVDARDVVVQVFGAAA